MKFADNSKSAERVSVTWVGTAGCRIADSSTAFYIDPFVSRPGLLKVALRRPLAVRHDWIEHWDKTLSLQDGLCAAAVIVCHSHYDHCMDAPFFARRCNAVLMGSESTAWAARGAGLAEEQIRVVNPEETIEIGRFRIRFLKSMHGPALFGRVPFPGRNTGPVVPPAPAAAYRLGQMLVPVICHPAGTLIHNGSAGYISGMFNDVRADVVLQCLAGRADSGSLFDQIAIASGAATMIPIHYDNFFLPPDKPFKPLPGIKMEEFKKTAEKYEKYCRIRWIEPGRPERVL